MTTGMTEGMTAGTESAGSGAGGTKTASNDPGLPPPVRKRGASRWQLALGLVATGVFAWLFARGLEWEEVRREMSGLSVPVLLLAVGFQVLSWLLRIARWWLLLRPGAPGLSFRACAGPFLAGMAVNNVLPLRAGDALRLAGFVRQLQSPALRVAGTLVVERVLDVAVLAGVFFVCLLVAPTAALPPGVVEGLAWLVGAAAAATLAILLFPSLLARLSARSSARPESGVGGGRFPAGRFGRRFPAARRLVERGRRHCADFAEGLALARSRKRMVALAGVSVAAWISEGALFATIAAGLDSGAAPLGPWLALATGTLSTMIPAGPGHLGTFDYFAMVGLAAYGAAPAAAEAFALVVHATLWTTSTVVGLTWLALSAAGRRRSGHRPGRRPDPR